MSGYEISLRELNSECECITLHIHLFLCIPWRQLDHLEITIAAACLTACRILFLWFPGFYYSKRKEVWVFNKHPLECRYFLWKLVNKLRWCVKLRGDFFATRSNLHHEWRLGGSMCLCELGQAPQGLKVISFIRFFYKGVFVFFL